MFLGPIILSDDARARIRAVIDEKSESEVRDLLEDCITSSQKLHVVAHIFERRQDPESAELISSAAKAVAEEINRLYAERTAWKTIRRTEDVQA